MPEGHVVHVDAQRFDRRMQGRVVRASSPQGRFAAGAAALDGRTLRPRRGVRQEPVPALLASRAAPAASAAKPWLHVHLGLIGGWRWYDADGAQTDGSALVAAGGANRRLLLEAGRGADAVSCDLRGAMTCALVDDGGLDRVLEGLGPDPIRDDADPDAALAKVRRSRAPLGTLLLRQDVVSGAGLIWRAEAPFLAGIAPQRPGRDVDDDEWAGLGPPALDHEGGRRARRGGDHDQTRRPARQPSPGDARERLLPVPPRRRAVPGLLDHDPVRADGGPYRLVVPHLPTRVTSDILTSRHSQR